MTEQTNAEKRAAATNENEGYLATIDSIEPDINSIDPGAFYASAAISLKRIADALDAQPSANDTGQAAHIIANELGCTNNEALALMIINALAIGGFKIVRK